MVNVVEVNTKLNPNIEINPQLASTSKLTSKSTIANIAKRNNSIVAINGTYFKPQTGVPLGTLMINKKLYTGPIYNRVAMGFFDNLVSKARAGLIVPITGFAHAMTSSMIDYKKEGLVTGIGSNAFKLTGSVILYGVLSAYVFGIVRYLFFGG